MTEEGSSDYSPSEDTREGQSRPRTEQARDRDTGPAVNGHPPQTKPGHARPSSTDPGNRAEQAPVSRDSHGGPQLNGLKSPSSRNGSAVPEVTLVTPNGRGSKGEGKGEDEVEAEKEEEEGGARGCCGSRGKTKAPSVGSLELFKYASGVEIVMMVFGMVAATATGVAQPLNMVVFGETVNKFIGVMQEIQATNKTNNGTANGTTPSEITSEMRASYGEVVQREMQPLIIFFVIIGAVSLATAFLSSWLWTWCGERQINRIRKLFFKAVLRQDIGWFDTNKGGELTSRFADDIYKIHEGMGDKIPVFVQWMATFIACYIIALVKGWKLALCIFAFTPFFVLVGGVVARVSRSMGVLELKAYAKAGALADQALRAIRTVQAFQGQEKEMKRYENNLGEAKDVGIRKGFILGLGFGLFWTVMYVTFAVAFYLGVLFMQQDGLAPGNIITVFFAVLIGSMSLGNAFPNLESLANARAAAVKVYEIIDLRPIIDVSSDDGVKLQKLVGVIEFKDISFRYPARPDIEILKGFNLTVNPGETVALVGPSGCGKSTTIQLLQRFYDPHAGKVTIDGQDIRTVNVKWLRDQMGVVSQEPVLFATTIADNIRYGNPTASQADIEAAAKEANVHNFIASLPLGYETMIGERGAQLSGGQKQRIAIARALVKNPRILLLDEATSALDHESEALVQNALEKAGKGRTTFVIAHRLSTIRGADRIVAISQGRKVEEGSHEELMQLPDGLYAQLVKLQTKAVKEGVEELDELEIIEEEELEVPSADGDTGKPEHHHKIFLRSVSRASQRSGDRRGSVSSQRRASVSSQRRGSLADPSGVTGLDGVSRLDQEIEEDKKAKPAGALEVLKLNSPEWVYIAVGTFVSAIAGLSQPCFAFVFAEFLRVFALPDRDEQTRQTAILSAIIGSVGVLIAIVRFAAGYTFAKSGSELTARIRLLAFQAMLRQDMSYFDSQENQVGVLTTRLATDAAIIQGATGSKLGAILEAMSTLVAALVIAFVYGWKLTLVILAFLPIMVLSGKVQGSLVAGTAKSEKSQLQEAGKLFSEAVDNIRTVTSINRSDVFIEKLEKLTKAMSRNGCKTSPAYGITYGLSIGIVYFAFAGAFAFGTKLVADGEMDFYNIFRVFSAIIFGGASVGRSASFGLDYTKARVAASRLFEIMRTVPKVEMEQKGSTIDNYKGTVSLDRVMFRYPTRPTVPVLQGLTIRMEAGQTVALVGSSGCGKSTVMQLLQRFYDPESGSVLVQDKDLRSLDLRWFRQQVGIVSQEPTLFDDTIANNIAYGDNNRTVPMEEVISAARAANIHTFIQSLPQGYETNVGDKGTQLSGGQKQRIAIARALVRQPKVLLLDEATSALDTESERVVQEALDKARLGRTCVVIAHRLSTIQNADLIAVVHEGQLHEMGTHAQLVALQGKYYSLLSSQDHGARNNEAVS